MYCTACWKTVTFSIKVWSASTWAPKRVSCVVADVRSAPTPGERALLDLAIRAVVGEPESDRPVELTLFELDPGLTA